MPKTEKITFTIEQLKAFYLEAYSQGREMKNMCGGLSKIYLEDLEIRHIARLTHNCSSFAF